MRRETRKPGDEHWLVTLRYFEVVGSHHDSALPWKARGTFLKMWFNKTEGERS